MLITRVSPADQSFDKEVKYMLTADIERMANLIGVNANWLRTLLSCNSETNQSFYGSARPEEFFLNFNEGDNANTVRRLGLETTDVRLHGPYRVDASQSLVTVPLTVMHPIFVGDLQNENGVGYELIPHVKLTAPHMGGQSHYVFRNMPQPFRDFALDEASLDRFEIDLTLRGFDLVLLPDPESSPSEGLKPMVTAMKAMYENHDVTYDFGFGVTLEYVYTSDMREQLRIDHFVSYKNDVVFTCEARQLLNPAEILKCAVQHLNLNGGKEDNFEAYEIMRCLRDSPDYEGIGYRRS